MMSPARIRTTLISLLFSLPVGALSAYAQQNAAQGKAFDVVSIRQNISQTGSKSLTSPTPTGFQVTRIPLSIVLMTAYTPKAGGMFLGNIDDMPDWARRENYDIDARISEADRAAWNDPKNQPAMLQQMLQTMLADRLKLGVHRSMKEVAVYDLVVAKGGPKLTETDPKEPLPAGHVLPDGTVVVPGQGGPHLYNCSMGLLASGLSEDSGRTVLDKTGLTGRYNIVMPTPERELHADGKDGAAPDDPTPMIFDMVKPLGLELKPAKEQTEFLVIDHVERPTEN